MYQTRRFITESMCHQCQNRITTGPNIQTYNYLINTMHNEKALKENHYNKTSNERTLDEKCDVIREEMKSIAQFIWEMRTDAIMANAVDKESQGEIIANLTLSYRALEDASMRLGKVKNYL